MGMAIDDHAVVLGGRQAAPARPALLWLRAGLALPLSPPGPADACAQRAVELINALTGQPVWTWTDAAAVSLSTGSAYRALSRRGGPCDKEQPGEIVREPEALPHAHVVADALSAQCHRPGRKR